MEAPGRLVDIGGRRLHAIAAGEARPTVVFESGGGGGVSLSDLPVLRRVSHFARALLYDRAGLGFSDPGPRGRSFEERAGDLHALLTALGESPPYVVVGSSFGGWGARAFCRAWPDAVAGMVLVDTADEAKYFPTMARMRGFHEQELRDAARQAEGGEIRRGLEARLRGSRLFDDAEKAALLEVVSRPAHFEAALEELSALDRTTPAMQVAGGFGGLGERPLVVLSHGLPYAGEMAVWEEGWAASQARLAALSARSAHIVVEGAGHSIGLERPDVVVAAVGAVARAVLGGPFDTGEVRGLAGPHGSGG